MFKISSLTFSPLQMTTLENKIQLNIDNSNLFPSLKIHFEKILKIDQNLDFIKNIGLLSGLDVFFYHTNLRFTPNDCNRTQNYDLFKNIISLAFTVSIKFHQQTFPYVFNQAIMDSLTIFGLSNVFIRKNLTGFNKINQTVNARFTALAIYFYKAELDESVLSQNLFWSITELNLKGRLDYIDDNLVEKLSNLQNLSLELIFRKQNLLDLNLALKLRKINENDKKFTILV